MLITLSIRNFVLVKSLDLDFGDGFTALTGETGAGKSIVLAALNFVLGAKTARSAIRKGADNASVSAEFDIAPDHPAREILADNGVCIDPDETLIMRRTLREKGAARATINDTPVSAGLLQQLSDSLVEIHGQHAGQGLLDVSRHRQMLDSYANVRLELINCRKSWFDWQNAIEARKAVEGRLSRAQADREYLEHAVAELDALDPQDNEADSLAETRAKLQAAEKVAMAVKDAIKALDNAGVEKSLASASRALGRAASMPVFQSVDENDALKQQLEATNDSVERALIEAGEAYDAVSRLIAATEYSPDALEASETRLFALRAAARKYDVDVSQISSVRTRMRMQLDEIEHSDEALARAYHVEKEAAHKYTDSARTLTAKRTQSAQKLAKKVAKELRPLKLERAQFRVKIDPVSPETAGPGGCDKIAFEVETNPGSGFGPLHKIASGGEVARFALALRVCLAGAGDAGVLIFDEADVGVGGAVAASIGERMLTLSKDRQILAITHSPQVAAAADAQWRISKDSQSGQAFETSIDVLEHASRQEEIARMLAGAKITKEARAAADRLLARA